MMVLAWLPGFVRELGPMYRLVCALALGSSLCAWFFEPVLAGPRPAPKLLKPVNLTMINTAADVEGPNVEMDSRSPFLTADNHDLYYAEKTAVKVPAGLKQPALNFEIVRALRSDLRNPRQFTGPTFVQSVCTEADELHPWLAEDGL